MGNEKVSELQLGYLAFGFILGSSLVLSGGAPGPIRWIAILLGAVEGGLIVYIHTILAERFGRMSFVQICRLVFGKWLGIIPALMLFWFSLQLGGLVLENFGDYFNIAVMQQSPLAFFIIPLVAAGMYSVYGGIEVLARVAVVLVPVTVLVVAVLIVFLIPQFELSNMLPILPIDYKALLTSAHGAAMFPFAETVVFLMVFPTLSSHRRASRPMLTAVIAGGLLLAIASARNTAALGVLIDELVYPSHAAARLIQVGEIFTRLEILIAANFLTMGFIKISILLYAASQSLAQVLRVNSYRTLVIPTGLMMVVIAIAGFRNGFAENADFARNTWPIYAPLFTVILPTLVLLVAKLRRMHKENVQ